MAKISYETVQRIMGNADGKELLLFLVQSANEIDTLSDIKLDDPVELSIEVKARLRAKQKFDELIEVLVRGTEQRVDSAPNDDYVV